MWHRLNSRFALYFLPSLIARIDSLYEKLYFVFRTRISPLVSCGFATFFYYASFVLYLRKRVRREFYYTKLSEYIV